MIEIRILKRFTSSLCVISLLAAMFYPVPGYAATNDADEMPLLITEAYINDVPHDGLAPAGVTIDTCEFVEVYNQTDDPINFTDNYDLYHYRNTGSKEFQLSIYNVADDVIIPAHDSVIFWGVQKDKYAPTDHYPTTDEFKAAFGLDTVNESDDAYDAQIYQVNTTTAGGFYNTYNGSMRIKDKSATPKTICEAAYTPAADSSTGKSIEFKIGDAPNTMTIYQRNATPTPGKVNSAQYYTAPPVTYPDMDPLSLVITESYIDDISRPEWIPAGASTFDPFEYIEVYNPTNEDANFTDHYDLYHHRNSTDSNDLLPIYGETEDVIIPAHGTIVLWGYWYNKYKNALPEEIPSVADFRNALGISGDIPVYQVNTSPCSGFYNTYNGSMRIKDKNENMICEAAYTAATDSADGKSIDFRIPPEGTTMLVYGQMSDPSPGTVTGEQITAPPIPNTPVFGMVTAPSTCETGEDLEIEAEITDAKSASLFLKQGSTPYQEFPMEDKEDGSFNVVIPREKLWGTDLSWHITAVNQTKSASSDEQSTHMEHTYSSSDQPQVLMTELKTEDTDYNYIEFYNNSDSTINFAHYNVFYEYPSGLSYLKWTFNVNSLPVESGKTLVVWINDDDKTVAQFNSHYKVSLEENKSIIKVDYSGMSPDVERTIKLGNIYDNIEVLGTYHEDEIDDTAKTTSIHYTYSRDNAKRVIKADMQNDPSPGTVTSWQVPDVRVPFNDYGGYPDDETTMVLSARDEIPSSIKEGEALNFAFNCYDTGTGVNTIETYYKFDNETDYHVKLEKTQRIAKEFIPSIPASEFLGHEKITFFIRAYNAYRSFATDEYQIEILPSGDAGTSVLNLEDGQILSEITSVTAAVESGDTLSISLDGKEQTLSPMMANGSYFSYHADNLASYYKNAITVGNDVIKLLSSWAGVNSEAAYIDSHYFTQNENGDYEVTVTLRAGTQGSPFEEKKDGDYSAFTLSNMALYLPNGTFLYPDEGVGYDSIYTIGQDTDSLTQNVHFTVPKDLADAQGFVMDINDLPAGEHTITATLNGEETSVRFIIDHIAPVVALGIEGGQILKSGTVISPLVSDEGSGIDESQTVITLDGKRIEIPYTVFGSNLENGNHTLTASYTDYAGHTTEETVQFTTSYNNPLAQLSSSDQTSHSAALSVQVETADDTPVKVEFKEGNAYSLKDGTIEIWSGAGDNPLTDLGTGSLSASSEKELPYQLFMISAGALDDDDLITANWQGNSDADGTLQMFVLNVKSGKWESIGSAKSVSDAEQIKVSFEARDHLQDGKALLLVQNRGTDSYPSAKGTWPSSDSVGTFQTPEASGQQTAEWDGTGVPEDYDFSFAWISDPQYYVESWPELYTDMNQWILDNRDNYNIQYTINTGDLVDEWDRNEQWQIADEAQALLDDAKMPNGVLAGNHDVASGNEEYASYWKYFGADRYEDEDYYGGTYRNNLGHYDLISAGGQDFIILYMSWDVYQSEVDWMNEVLAKYLDRKAIIAMHRYLKQGATLDYAGELVQNEVVAKNPNVFAVINGHYFGAAIKIDAFDDNKDGTAERKVYQICTDYQGAEKGGLEYLKMIYFDLDRNKIYMNAYSPYLDDFNYFDNKKLASYDAGLAVSSQDIYELDIPFNTDLKTLTTSLLDVDVYKNNIIDTAENISDNAKVTWNGLSSNTGYWWYASIISTDGDRFDTELAQVHTRRSNGNGNGSNQSPQDKNEAVPSGSSGIVISNGSAEIASTKTEMKGTQIVSTLTLDQVKMTEMLKEIKASSLVTLQFQDSPDVAQGLLSGQTMKEFADKGINLQINSGNVNYLIPTIYLNFDEMRKQLGSDLTPEEMQFSISIHKETSESLAEISNEAKQHDYKLLAEPVSFEITCTANGKSVDIVHFSGYIQRRLPISEEDALNGHITGVVLSSDGTFSHVPTEIKEIDGVWYAVVSSMTNSTYAVIRNTMNFSDMANHWARADAEEMGERLILTGRDGNIFDPDADMSRSEFVTAIVRALGLLRTGTGEPVFPDVSGNDWYYDAAFAAYSNKILTGDDNGNFNAGDPISREQAMTIIARAMTLTGLDPDLGTEDVESILSRFHDSDKASQWSEAGIADCIKTGIIRGDQNLMISPKDNISRAEVAVILKRLLKSSDLI